MAAHYNASITSQQNWFASMMASQQQMFNQTMMIMQKGHDIALSQMTANTQNPMAMVQVMMQGLQMGMGMNNEDDDPDWLKGIREAGGMLENLAGMALNPGAPNPQQINVKVEDKKPAPPPGTTKAGKKIFEKEEIVGVVKLKEILRARGIDFNTYLEHTTKLYASQQAKEAQADNNAGDAPNSASESESETKESE
jgi:hypothetical protein